MVPRRTVAFVAAGALAAACAAPVNSPGFGGGGNDPSGTGGSVAGQGDTSGGSNSSGGSGSSGSFGSSTGGGGVDAGTDGTGPIDVTPPCDTGLAIDDANPASFAHAIGICTDASTAGYGLVSATYSKAFGTTTPPAAGQWGLLPSFGKVVRPREGASMGALSSGYAREWDDLTGVPQGANSDFVGSGGGPRDGMGYPTGQAPPGFPKAAQGCSQNNLVNDMIDVKLVLKAPQGATGFQFDFDFFSSEWPNYVCSDFNDAFIAYLTSSGTTDNISFDTNHNPVAVNIDFFNRCTPGAPVGCLRSNGPNSDPPLGTSTCSAGAAELAGTGFGDMDQTQCVSGNVTATLGGATGWLTTQAPIKSGEQFTLEFMIWDAGDGLLDSNVLIDHFQWIGGIPVTTGTTPAQ
jgi:hypothetical protein